MEYHCCTSTAHNDIRVYYTQATQENGKLPFQPSSPREIPSIYLQKVILCRLRGKEQTQNKEISKTGFCITEIEFFQAASATTRT